MLIFTWQDSALHLRFGEQAGAGIVAGQNGGESDTRQVVARDRGQARGCGRLDQDAKSAGARRMPSSSAESGTTTMSSTT